MSEEKENEKGKRPAKLIKKIPVEEERELPDDQAVFAEGLAQRITNDKEFVDKIAEAAKAKIADDIKKKIEEELAVVKEVAEVQRKHASFANMKADIQDEEDLNKEIDEEDE